MTGEQMVVCMGVTEKGYKKVLAFTQATTELHRLGLFEELRRSLKATNCIENLNEQVESNTSNVKRWHHSPQRHRFPTKFAFTPND
ncbi:MAG: hypothetical protein BRD42_10075 [Bacteroidetes bacterium QS_3_64_15]|nr:MAG: hypothetical protein BRD42_10075 [Bacteroidetes bacterium QS_3_64_15]